MSGAGRRPVTSDSRVRSSRGVAGWRSYPDEEPGVGVLSPLRTQNEKNQRPLERENRKHRAFDLTVHGFIVERLT